MTDTSAPITSNGPAGVTPDTEANDFDANWQSFLTHEFDREEEPEEEEAK
jgi:hypothetical protein